jgi:hypothetical protein
MNKSFLTAMRKGREAFHAGQKRNDCPYRDVRTDHGAVTFSRGFMRAWLEGFDDAARKARA